MTGLLPAFFAIGVVLAPAALGNAASEEVAVPAGSYLPFFALKSKEEKADARKPVPVAAFRMDRYPVTQAEYLEFVRARPEWRKSRIKPLFSDGNYLSNWRSDLAFPAKEKKSPVTRVSWYAAEAYCEWKGKTLPTVNQWEYAASDLGKNAEGSRERVLKWYSNPTPAAIPPVGSASVSSLGIHDLHGLVWEWTLDFNSLIQGQESRENGTKDPDLFCGPGSRGALDPTDYAAFMRYSFRNSLKASYTVANLGFRCARGTNDE